MFTYFTWCNILLLTIHLGNQVFGQTGGTTSTGDSYVCVPVGSCNNSGGTTPPLPTGPGIDPRIVTPGTGLCPANTVPCYTQGPNSQCGVRYIPQTNTNDGNADTGTFPWQAYLQNATAAFAGSGVLIDNYHILTAAHKVAGAVANPSSVRVFMGVYNPSDLVTNVQNRSVTNIYLHPQYNATTLRNDIAILRVNPPFALSQTNINSACLPTTATSFINAQRCVVAGWGQTSFTTNDAPTRPMKQVYVNVVDYTTCRTSYANTSLLGTNVDLYLDQAGEICAGGQAQRDACTQDGGSPLICTGANNRSTIAGLVIWGKNCGQNGVYGVYVSVPFYRGWIDTTITSANAAAGK